MSKFSVLETCPGWHQAFAFCFCRPEIPGKIPVSQGHCLRSPVAKGKGASFSLEHLHFSHAGDSRRGPGSPGLQGRLGCEEGSWGLVPECTGVFLIPPRSGDSLAVFDVLHIPSVLWLLFLGACPAQSARPYLQASLCTWNSGPELVLLRTRFHKPAGGCRWRPWTAGPSWSTDPLTSKCAVLSVLRSSCKALASSPVLGGDFLTCDKSHHSKDTTCRVPEV